MNTCKVDMCIYTTKETIIIVTMWLYQLYYTIFQCLLA